MSRDPRRLFPREEEPTAEPGRFGCPMLMRAHRMIPPRGTMPNWRCSVGWAVHNDDEAERCLAVDAVIDCWKNHPERAGANGVISAPGPTPLGREQKASAD